MHAPLWQASGAEHEFWSSQGVPFATKASAGQVLLVPLQFSAMSHCPAAGRQTTIDPATLSLGHVFVVPSHVSETSQTPAAERHTVPVGFFASAEQLGPFPG